MKPEMRRSLESILVASSVAGFTMACAATLGDGSENGQNAERAASDLSAQSAKLEADSQRGGHRHPKGTRRHHQHTDAECNKTACTPQPCATVTPTNALITDWKDVNDLGLFVDNDSFSKPGQDWWLGFFGGPYVYPAVDPCSKAAPPKYPLEQAVDGVWNVTGTVGTWSGFGLWFAPCMVDLTAYQGISVEVWGNVGETREVNMSVLTSRDSGPSQCMTNVGTCDPGAGTCRSPSKSITVPVTPGEPVTVLWSDLTGGWPSDGVEPNEIIGLHWSFQRVEWGGVVTPPFQVDVHVGTIRLIP